eukprot:gene39460-48040_t
MSYTTIPSAVQALLVCSCNESPSSNVNTTVLVSSSDFILVLQSAGFGTLFHNVEEQLLLSEEETLFLMLQGKLSLNCASKDRSVEADAKEVAVSGEDFLHVCMRKDPFFPQRLAVYSHFRSLNFVVRSALQFGCSFALYRAPPSRRHSEHLVLLLRAGETLSWREVSSLTRIAPDVMKTLLLCWVEQQRDFEEPEGSAQAVRYANLFDEVQLPVSSLSDLARMRVFSQAVQVRRVQVGERYVHIQDTALRNERGAALRKERDRRPLPTLTLPSSANANPSAVKSKKSQKRRRASADNEAAARRKGDSRGNALWSLLSRHGEQNRSSLRDELGNLISVMNN